MEITLENTGPSKKILKVKIPPQRVRQAFDEFYGRLAPRAKVAGFREGRVPRNILEKNFHQEAREKVVQDSIPRVYHEVVQDKQLKPALPPLVLKIEWGLDESLYFEAQVDLVPQVKLPSYKGIRVEIEQAEASEQEVTKALEHLREKHAELVPASGRGIRSGDMVLLDQKISVEGNILEDSKDLTYEVSEERLNMEMYKGLLNSKAGDSVEVTMPIGENHPKKELIGKQAKVQLAVKEIKEKKLPELNDDFAKDIGEYQNLEDLKGKIRESLDRYQKEMARLQTESKINEFLVKNSQMDLPARLVERQKRHLHQNAVQRQQAPEKPDEAYWKALALRAEDQLKLYFAYGKVAEIEKISWSDAELDEKISRIAKKVGQGAGVVREYYNKEDRLEDLKDRIVQDKVAEFLISQAKVTHGQKA